jgi:succinate dehydrogenase / fumarate reductase, membrane anchor subunit
MSTETPLRRVRYLGSARAGTTTFIAERLSGVVLALLTPIILGFAFYAAGKELAEIKAFIGHPIVATLLIAFLALSAEHMRMGMRVVIEDYIHTRTLKTIFLISNIILSWGAGLVGSVSILIIALR